MTETPRVVDDLDRSAEAFSHLVQRVAADQWALPTPCTEWNVRQLVNHVAGGNRWFAASLSGTSPPERSADMLGDVPAGSVSSAASALREALVLPGVLERTFPTPIGDQPGEVVGYIRVHEMLVHGWDLARATGQSSAGLPEEMAERGLAQMRTAFSGGRPPGMFGPEQPAPDEAPAIDRYAAFLGRPL